MQRISQIPRSGQNTLSFISIEMEIKRSLVFIFLFALSACSSERPAGTEGKLAAGPSSVQAPVAGLPFSSSAATYSLEVIGGADLTRTTTLSLRVNGFDPVASRFEWLINGAVVGSGTTLSMRNVPSKKGDNVQAKAHFQGREIASNILTVKNSPPELTKVKIMPEVFKPGDTLNIEAAGDDIDGDPVELFIEWTRNGEPAGKGRSIEGPVRRGDRISVKITAFDGERYSVPVVLNREIKNMPPMIIDDKKSAYDGGVYTYYLRGSDPDGDTLTFALKSGPAGMTINPQTGVVTWKVPGDFKGKAAFVVTANDGHGGEASQTFNVEIK
ncbi:hypothetical protein NBG4_280015 [Candidatus Sulfobium mesophilum]|uniref:Uncharacterized protein n=1 Tax=Candidatus Sulfobium mesophilum TaxID=2016548 RepID=A0A2U3QGQ4_9BACT|nr:hypothetical protein NBG4_280015 [Candidatus Sulfobium mesophilum]